MGHVNYAAVTYCNYVLGDTNFECLSNSIGYKMFRPNDFYSDCSLHAEYGWVYCMYTGFNTDCICTCMYLHLNCFSPCLFPFF